jgi:hypothetical protein
MSYLKFPEKSVVTHLKKFAKMFPENYARMSSETNAVSFLLSVK